MYYLEKEAFKPLMIFLGIVFIPLLILNIITIIIDQSLVLVISLPCLCLAYGLSIFGSYKLCNSKKQFMKMEDDIIEIVYSGVNQGKNTLTINLSQVMYFHYYKMNSFESWFLAALGTPPNSFFITYIHDDGCEITEQIGYMKYSDVIDIGKKYNIQIVMH